MSAAMPRVLVVAGPNGSGKTALTEDLRAWPNFPFPFPEHYINADDIAAELRQRGVPEADRAAFHEGRKLRIHHREARHDFAYETVLSHPSGLLDLEKLRKAGYDSTFIGVATRNPELNVNRVRKRVLAGGHSVPDDTIRSRWKRSLGHFPRAIEACGRAVIFDSGDRITPCLEYLNGVPRRSFAPPKYLVERVERPMKSRSDGRRRIASLWNGEATPILPDEEDAEYSGLIVLAVGGLFVQDAKGRGLVTHDGSLLSSPPPNGLPCVIRYYEGVGTVIPYRNTFSGVTLARPAATSQAVLPASH